MIVDSSALVAILVAQPGYEPVLDRISRTDWVGVGAPTLAETGIVVSSRVGVAGRTLLARLLQESGMVIVPFGDHHWSVAVDAFVRFGKGRHPAALNLGDCLTYATARVAAQPLLCLGDDFARTDLSLA